MNTKTTLSGLYDDMRPRELTEVSIDAGFQNINLLDFINIAAKYTLRQFKSQNTPTTVVCETTGNNVQIYFNQHILSDGIISIPFRTASTISMQHKVNARFRTKVTLTQPRTVMHILIKSLQLQEDHSIEIDMRQLIKLSTPTLELYAWLKERHSEQKRKAQLNSTPLEKLLGDLLIHPTSSDEEKLIEWYRKQRQSQVSNQNVKPNQGVHNSNT